jgi:hypothetical protein
MVWPQNHWDNFLWFGHKIYGDGFFWFVNGFLHFASKPVATVSISLASKLVVGFLVEPQN